MGTTSTAGLQAHQESAYSRGHDYRSEAPHLKHHRLYDRLTSRLRAEVARVECADLPVTVLEVGAGDGAFVEPLLASGCQVAITEMSRPSIESLEGRFGRNRQFESFFDPDGTMDVLGDRQFGLVLFGSVLHHIPDYLATTQKVVESHLLPGGSLVSFQDPLWYPGLPRGAHALSDAMYLSWRVTRGNLARGILSRVRRARHQLREDRPGDMVEYHVVRQGVDQNAIAGLLAPRFEKVEVDKYWSTHANVWQAVGERMGLQNTFAVWASNHRLSTS